MMTFRKNAFVFLAAVCLSLAAFTAGQTVAQVQFRGGGGGGSTPKKVESPVQQARCPHCNAVYPANTRHDCPIVRCGNCGQVYNKLRGHNCGIAICGKCGARYDKYGGHDCPRDYTICSQCRQRYKVGTFHLCPVEIKNVIDNAKPRDERVRCRTCLQTYWSSQGHNCPGRRPPVQEEQPSVVEVEGNEIVPPTPAKPPVVQSGNTSQVKPAQLKLANYQAMQKIFGTALGLTQGDVQNAMPSEQKIMDQITKEISSGRMTINPPTTVAEIAHAVATGDALGLQGHLNNVAGTGGFNGTLINIANVNGALNNGMPVPPSILSDLLKNGTSGLVSTSLSSSLKTLGVLQKIDAIFNIATSILTGGGSFSMNVPTGIVPIVPVPNVPFGVIFPLGNGVWGMGTAGGQNINTGIYQGYLPQPPVYSGSAAVTGGGAAGATPAVIDNCTDQNIEYYWNNNNRVQKISANSWISFGDIGSATGIRIRKAGAKKWEKFDFAAGAYGIVDSIDNSIALEEAPTKITLKSPGNPIPFKLYANDTKFTIEPGKPLELSLNGSNQVMTIRFARSSNKEDVAEHVVGGMQSFEIGVDKSSGKFKLFPGGTTQVEPPAPQQSVTAASSTIAYDDTKITAANVSDLPVLPDYD